MGEGRHGHGGDHEKPGSGSPLQAHGAEDFEANDECYEITTAPEDFAKVREALESQGLEFLQAEVQMVPSTYIKLDEKDGEKMQRLIDNLEDLDDVMNVYHNWDE